ncbi:unnamed protein product [Caenorhabditis brenneri]
MIETLDSHKKDMKIFRRHASSETKDTRHPYVCSLSLSCTTSVLMSGLGMYTSTFTKENSAGYKYAKELYQE